MSVLNEELWMQNYNLAKEYYNKHGCLIFNAVELSSQELIIRNWIYTQRHKGSQGKLPPDKFQLLEEIEIVWNPREDSWIKAFHIAKKYIEENGHCSPPRKYIVDNVNLNNWFTTQRKDYKTGKLSQYKIDKLNSIGMVWKVQEESWDYHFKLFQDYVIAFGNAYIEDQYKTNDGVHLGQWIGQQRKDYKAGKLSKDRILKLESLGVIWDVYEMMWQKMFSLAKEYYDLYGDSLIPIDYVVGDIKLGLWLKNQRGDYRAGIVPQHRIELFKEIDMRWDVKSIGSTSFPEQAIFYYFSRIFPDTIHRYTDLGLEFDIYIPSLKVAIEYDGAAWHKAKQAIAKELNKNDFCNNNHISLYRVREMPLDLYSDCFCYSVKARDYVALKNIIFDIFKKLNILKINRSDLNITRDFQNIYSQYIETSTREWKKGLLSAKTYYSSNGHLIVPINYVDCNGFRLGQWLATQRRYYKNNELSEKKIKQLDEIEMLWISKFEYNWMRSYKLVVDYYKLHNNLDIPYNYRIQGVTLKSWLNKQKAKLKDKKLSKEQELLLQEIGIMS